jgi:S1-C subfamily serine protease
VNLLDLLLVALALVAAMGGYRLGLLARSLSWAGMGLGFVVAARFLPGLVDTINGPDPTGRFMMGMGILLGGAFVGQALGLLIGSRAHLALPASGRPVDRVGGAVAGVIGVLVAVWLLLPAMADVPGTLSRQARNSVIARFVATTAPAPPDTLQALRRLVGDTHFPRVFSGIRPAPNVGPPPAESGLTEEVLQAAVASTVRVEGPACGRIQEGSGFVAEPGVVVTNAHVVAGEDRTSLVTRDGSRVGATVVHFDPDRDLAVLVAQVSAPPLAIGQSAIGTRGAVLGYPGGGDLRVAPFEVRDEVQAVGRDLYDRHDTRRQVLVLASALAPGDSGGALVDAEGAVVGVAFAIAPDRPGTAYALDTDELRSALAAPRNGPADTGPCLN